MTSLKFVTSLYFLTQLASGVPCAAQPEAAIESVPVSNADLRYPDLIRQFYSTGNRQLFWFDTGADFAGKREALFRSIAGADSLGLSPATYYRPALKEFRDMPRGSEEQVRKADYRLTDAAIAFCKDLYAGFDMQKWVSYDGISSAFADLDNNYVVASLSSVSNAEEWAGMILRLEPACEGYNTLKAALKDCLTEKSTFQIKQLSASLNYYRWIRHFHLDSFIVINIASATLDYYKRDSLILSMKTVMGTPETRTPRFAAYVKEVTLYPYWNMPRSILVNEWLPAFRKNPAVLGFLGMEIIDTKGRIVSPSSINWSTVNSANFPYRIREKTGCLNPLGVIKFSLTSPYDVYLHDTNFKGAFLSGNRYYSHGCIRVQNSVGLADAVLINKVDTGFLSACYRDQLPQVLPVVNPVPVFVVYMTAEPGDGGIVRYYRDVYKLLK